MKNPALKWCLAAMTLVSAQALAAESATGGRNAFKFVGDLKYSVFCKAVVVDDVSLFNKAVRRQVGKIAESPRQVAEQITAPSGVLCNGETLADFARQRNAHKLQDYLASI